MNSFFAIALIAIFSLLAALHGYWVAGGTWGNQVSVPTQPDGKPLFVPNAPTTLAVMFGLLFLGLLVATIAGCLPIALPASLDRYGLYGVAALFMLRAIGDFRYVGFSKRYRNTPFAQNDTRYYSPLCLLISLLAIGLAICR